MLVPPDLPRKLTPTLNLGGTIQKFAIAGARHRGTERHRAQVQSSYADYRRWVAEEMAAL